VRVREFHQFFKPAQTGGYFLQGNQIKAADYSGREEQTLLRTVIAELADIPCGRQQGIRYRFLRYVPIKAAAQFQQALCRARAFGGIQIFQRMAAGHKNCFLTCFIRNIPVADFPVIINVNFRMAFRLRDGYLPNENCRAVVIFRCDVFRDGNGRTRADRQRQPAGRMQRLLYRPKQICL
jgi:hypothetical protein